jgi:hypothetical protein
MFLAGIQAEFGLDPRLKHSGVTLSRVASLERSRIFEEGHEVMVPKVQIEKTNREISRKENPPFIPL